MICNLSHDIIHMKYVKVVSSKVPALPLSRQRHYVMDRWS